ncbi:MAG: DUF4124 domain-containing protein, partial [Burkholderiales bacterium]
MRLPWVTLIAVALATPATAQMAYRNVFPDGRVIYSDRPLAGAEQQSTIAPPPPSADPAPASAAAPGEAVAGARWPPPP